MNSLETLRNTDDALNETLNVVKTSVSFASKEVDRKVRSLTLAISKELKVDYSKTMKFKPGEKERLTQIFIDYLTGKSDDFNSHYIQLLAWQLLELKIIPTKKDYKLSIFEYSPNPLALYSVIEKTFKLFNKKRINVEKISYALILNYLNNYKIASNRYKNELKKYLKSIRFSEDIDVYFNINNVIQYTMNKTVKLVPPMEPYPERLLHLKIRTRTLDTIYFADSWFAWMFNMADLTSDYVLRNLNCSYFKVCNSDCQKIILAKVIHTNKQSFVNNGEMICMSFIFPAIKNGNPLKKEFWDLNYTGIYNFYLESAWNYIEKVFVKNEEYKNMVNFEA